MNSGSTLNLWSLNTRATKIAKLTAVNLGVASTNNTQLVENLRGVEVEILVRTSWGTGWGVILYYLFSTQSLKKILGVLN